MKKIFTLFAALMMLSASAETLNLYFDATEYLPAAPFNSLYLDEVGMKTQVVYPAADLVDMVGKEITAITFYTEPEGMGYDGGLLNISLGETDVNVVTNYITEGMTQVGTCTFTEQQGEVVEYTITFDTPYLYNGGNLVFENVVVEAVQTDYTYWTGVKINYNNCVTFSFGSVTPRAFLPKTTFTFGSDDPQPQFIRGDVDGSGSVGIADVSALIDYLLAGTWD